MTGEFHVLSGLEAVSHKAASVFIKLSESSIASKGRFSVALSGGSTPGRLYAFLGSEYRDNIQWDSVDFFWGDERCVSKEHEQSNFKSAYDALLSKVSANIHRVKGELGPERAAIEYENDIRMHFRLKSGLPVFDLIVLGMGEDGHTASLFPGSESLKETERLAVPVYDVEIPRVTLTLPVLNNASHLLFLVAGRSKAEVLRHIFENEDKRYDYPAGLISPVHGDVTWLIDKDAATGIKGGSGAL